MPGIEKVSIALPSEMISQVRQAVEAGEYSSSSEVVRDALRTWSENRKVRAAYLDHLKKVWAEALSKETPGVDSQVVMGRLLKKYKAQK